MMMKKVFVVVALILVFATVLTGCVNAYNGTLLDTHYHFDYAIIQTATGAIEGEVQSWKDWDDSDVIQVTLTDGNTYYTHSTNVVLIDKP